MPRCSRRGSLRPPRMLLPRPPLLPRAQSTGTAGTATQTTPSTQPSPAAPGTGVFGYIEDNSAPVSAETIARHLCDTGYLGILLDQAGQSLNVGRDARLFNREQRRALAVRDGGCRWPGCDQPPSWSEAHHIQNWVDLGFSNIDQAILLCVLHHLLLHNRQWKILFLDGEYWLQPAVEFDPEQTLIALPSKNPLMQEPLRLDPPEVNPHATATADRGTLGDVGLDRRMVAPRRLGRVGRWRSRLAGSRGPRPLKREL
ncbi:HNH endonuclease [Cryobacterium flavum]|uniref:HNH endonuclease n=1 Tax=Cryobacterium flavum TaxID=1424659 RepID=A0ABY2I837_9MICO|nr:HNH endonuclease [Cryobacterium flavum]